VIVHLNGSLVPIAEASISPLDRGFIFGDGVYEGLRAEDGRVVALPRHTARLAQSLRLTSIAGFDPEDIQPVVSELLAANGLRDAFIYLQITRGAPPPGAPPRERRPSPGAAPTVFIYAQAETPIRAFTRPRTVRAITVPDIRWTMGHIKATSLLPNVMASITSADAGADDAIFVRGDIVSEGTATNVFVVRNGRIATPALDSVSLLAGVTRDVLCEAAPEIEQRVVRAEELRTADEILLTGTRTVLASVVELDGRPVGSGRIGPVAERTLATLREAILATLAPLPARTLRG
jgi:D-alanine transaminase